MKIKNILNKVGTGNWWRFVRAMLFRKTNIRPKAMIETNRSMNHTWIKGPAISQRPVSRKSFSRDSELPSVKHKTGTLKSGRGTRSIKSAFISEVNYSETTSTGERYVLDDLNRTSH